MGQIAETARGIQLLVAIQMLAARILNDSQMSYPADPRVMACTGGLLLTALPGETTCIARHPHDGGGGSLLIYDPTCPVERQDDEIGLVFSAYLLDVNDAPTVASDVAALSTALFGTRVEPEGLTGRTWFKPMTRRLARFL